MSRTFRIRHLPQLNATKYIDAASSLLHNRRRHLIESLACQTHPELFVKGHWSYFSFRWGISDSIDRDLVSPVLPKTSHPWVRWMRIAPVKAYYKRSGNRKVRRHNRQLLHAAHLDDEVDNHRCFYGKQDGWNMWDLY